MQGPQDERHRTEQARFDSLVEHAWPYHRPIIDRPQITGAVDESCPHAAPHGPRGYGDGTRAGNSGGTGVRVVRV